MWRIKSHKKGISSLIVIILLLILVSVFGIILIKVLSSTEKESISTAKAKKNLLIKSIKNGRISSKSFYFYSYFKDLDAKLSKQLPNYGVTKFYFSRDLSNLNDYNVIVILNSLFDLEGADVYIDNKSLDQNFYKILNMVGILNTTRENIYYKNGLLYTKSPITLPKNYYIIVDNGTIVDKGDHYEVELYGAKNFYFYPSSLSSTNKYFDYYIFYNNSNPNIFNSKVIVLKPANFFQIKKEYDSDRNNLVVTIYYPKVINSQEIKKIYDQLFERRKIEKILKEDPSKIFVIYTDSSFRYKCNNLIFLKSLQFLDNIYKFPLKRYCTYTNGYLIPYNNYYLDYNSPSIKIFPFFIDSNGEEYKFILDTLTSLNYQ